MDQSAIVEAAVRSEDECIVLRIEVGQLVIGGVLRRGEFVAETQVECKLRIYFEIVLDIAEVTRVPNSFANEVKAPLYSIQRRPPF
jgi:hypothetical protein